MQCPVCKDPQLVISERQGIEIDYCPACRGVWLDRGELDKLIEKATLASPPVQQGAPTYRADPKAPYPDPRYGSHKRPKSWLSEIFD